MQVVEWEGKYHPEGCGVAEELEVPGVSGVEQEISLEVLIEIRRSCLLRRPTGWEHP